MPLSSFEIRLGALGLHAQKNPDAIPPEALIEAEGVTFENDVVEKEPGRTKYNSTPISGSPKILALMDWKPVATQFLVAACSDGTLRRDDGTGTWPVTLKSGLGADLVTHVVEGGAEIAGNAKKLFFFNGTNPVQVLAGNNTTTSDLLTPPADWAGANQPKFGLLHNLRMWGGGNDNDRHRLYFSNTTSHEVFTGVGSGSLSVFPGQAERLAGAADFKGRLFVFKYPVGIFWVDDSSLTITDWSIKKLTDAIGAVSPWGILVLEDDVIFQAADGLLYSLSAVQAFGDIKPLSITDVYGLDVFVRENFDLGRLSRAHLRYNSVKREIVLAAAGPGQNKNNIRLMLNRKNPASTRYSVSRRDVCESLGTRLDNNVSKLISGDNAGTVFVHDAVNRSNAGAAYSGSFKTDHLSLGDASLKKPLKSLEVEFLPAGNHDLSVDILRDGKLSETVLFSMGDVGGKLDSFILGTDRLGGTPLIVRRKRLHGTAGRVSFKGYNTGLNQSFSVTRLRVQFMPGRRRETR